MPVNNPAILIFCPSRNVSDSSAFDKRISVVCSTPSKASWVGVHARCDRGPRAERIQAKTKLTQIRQKPAKPGQKRSKEKAWISLDSLGDYIVDTTRYMM